MTRNGINEVLPQQLYQRGHMLTWPAAKKRKALDELGVTMVVNLWNKVDPDLSGTAYLNLPMAGNSIPQTAADLVFYVALQIKRGECVLVQCEAGVNRSVWFCAELVAVLKGMSFAQALIFVSERVNRANVREGLRRDRLQSAPSEGASNEAPGVEDMRDVPAAHSQEIRNGAGG